MSSAAVNKSDQSFGRRTVKNSLSGTVSGIAGCWVGHPFDTLKVRLQTQPVDKPVYRGLADCFMKTLKWEGIGGLYKGVGALLLLLLCALLIFFVDSLIKSLINSLTLVNRFTA